MKKHIGIILLAVLPLTNISISNAFQTCTITTKCNNGGVASCSSMRATQQNCGLLSAGDKWLSCTAEGGYFEGICCDKNGNSVAVYGVNQISNLTRQCDNYGKIQ